MSDATHQRTAAFFKGAASPAIVKQADASLKAKVASQKTPWPGHSIVWLAALIFAIAAVSVWRAWDTPPIVCQCPVSTAHLVNKTAKPLHGPHTYQRRPMVRLKPHELDTGLMRGQSISDLVNALSWHLAVLKGTRSMLCMHELDHGLPLTEDRHICVLHRHDAMGQLLVMLNPELKGHSEESSVVVERPLLCKGAPLARRRYLAADIAFTMLGSKGSHIRLLLDAEAEAQSFQSEWDQLRGVYNCSK